MILGLYYKYSDEVLVFLLISGLESCNFWKIILGVISFNLLQDDLHDIKINKDPVLQSHTFPNNMIGNLSNQNAINCIIGNLSNQN